MYQRYCLREIMYMSSDADVVHNKYCIYDKSNDKDEIIL